MKSETSAKPARRKPGFGRLAFLLAVLFALIAVPARAQVQFDVFVGYGDLGGGGLVSEASWFPVVCELKNDGPTFTGTIEVSAGNYGQGQNMQLAVELPTGTRKRVSIPIFASGHYQRNWDFRLVDERGRSRAPDRLGAGARAVVPSGTLVLGALPKPITGKSPVIRQITSGSQDLQPEVAQFIEAGVLPDNPLLWEGMDAFYLNSENAPNLTQDQSDALLAWLNNGGRLIVAVDSISDVNGTPWLRDLVPMDLTGVQTIKDHYGLEDWLRAQPTGLMSRPTSRYSAQNLNGVINGVVNNYGYNYPFVSLPDDPEFDGNEISVAAGRLRGGETVLSSGNTPLMVAGRQGRGVVIALLFDPELEPTRSWRNLPTFWSKVAGVPPELYMNRGNVARASSSGIDGVFGAMIDSKQIRKLPVEWLLLLLIMYLVVIGPLDQYWLKRIRKPMLTWLTFPCYVVLFSLAIYLIGYKLRAGETEWNELHVVDVLPSGAQAELRGRTYYSIYSPINETYGVEGQQAFSVFRGEFANLYSAGSDEERAKVFQQGNNYRASIFVPVWTSQLYASDWWEPADMPLRASVGPDPSGWLVTIDNRQSQALSNVRLAISGYIYDLPGIPAGATVTNHVYRGQGQTLATFVQQFSGSFVSASQARQHAFGSTEGAHIADLPDSATAISVLGASPVSQPNFNGGYNYMGQTSFVTPPGMDLCPIAGNAAGDEAVLFAWESGEAPIKPVNLFPTRRSSKNTLWRLVLPVTSPTASSP